MVIHVEWKRSFWHTRSLAYVKWQDKELKCSPILRSLFSILLWIHNYIVIQNNFQLVVQSMQQYIWEQAHVRFIQWYFDLFRWLEFMLMWKHCSVQHHQARDQPTHLYMRHQERDRKKNRLSNAALPLH